MIWSSTASKWPIPNLLCGMDPQKSKFLVIYGTFSVRGCWGQLMLLFWKLVDETQISKPKEYTDTFREILTSIFLSVRTILKETVQCETPCIKLYWLLFPSWIAGSIIGLYFLVFLAAFDATSFRWFSHCSHLFNIKFALFFLIIIM
jgi:hypothetical protein